MYIYIYIYIYMTSCRCELSTKIILDLNSCRRNNQREALAFSVMISFAVLLHAILQHYFVNWTLSERHLISSWAPLPHRLSINASLLSNFSTFAVYKKRCTAIAPLKWIAPFVLSKENRHFLATWSKFGCARAYTFGDVFFIDYNLALTQTILSRKLLLRVCSNFTYIAEFSLRLRGYPRRM